MLMLTKELLPPGYGDTASSYEGVRSHLASPVEGRAVAFSQGYAQRNPALGLLTLLGQKKILEQILKSKKKSKKEKEQAAKKLKLLNIKIASAKKSPKVRAAIATARPRATPARPRAGTPARPRTTSPERPRPARPERPRPARPARPGVGPAPVMPQGPPPARLSVEQIEQCVRSILANPNDPMYAEVDALIDQLAESEDTLASMAPGAEKDQFAKTILATQQAIYAICNERVLGGPAGQVDLGDLALTNASVPTETKIKAGLLFGLGVPVVIGLLALPTFVINPWIVKQFKPEWGYGKRVATGMIGTALLGLARSALQRES